ncbi:MAG: ribulose-phosphate 3-epimerase [Candidatus Omnitrophica bacterium]|nr:ribulose-phosphate 3-epimerase [Candidatus Omnitrophota bacterium]
MKKIEVSASILSADFGKVADALKLCEDCGVERIHVDVMDGHFVPNITIGQVVTAAVRKYTKLSVEAHLMIEHPWDYIDSFIDAGADIIGLHVECYGLRRISCREYGQYPKEIDVLDAGMFERDMARIKARGREACAVINPGTPVTAIESVIAHAGSFLVMSVNPGFSGQKFIPSAIDKIRFIRSRSQADIGVDGGINLQTAPDVVKAGANVLITASYFFTSKDPAGAVKALKSFA